MCYAFRCQRSPIVMRSPLPGKSSAAVFEVVEGFGVASIRLSCAAPVKHS